MSTPRRSTPAAMPTAAEIGDVGDDGRRHQGRDHSADDGVDDRNQPRVGHEQVPRSDATADGAEAREHAHLIVAIRQGEVGPQLGCDLEVVVADPVDGHDGADVLDAQLEQSLEAREPDDEDRGQHDQGEDEEGRSGLGDLRGEGEGDDPGRERGQEEARPAIRVTDGRRAGTLQGEVLRGHDREHVLARGRRDVLHGRGLQAAAYATTQARRRPASGECEHRGHDDPKPQPITGIAPPHAHR